MTVLALDCSAKSVSCAIAKDGRLISEGFLNIKLTHSETLMPICEQVLSNARLTLKDIDAFAVTAGPGSFTGVRIGISAIKGMAFAEQKKVYPFSTLLAMALTFSKSAAFEGIICGLMDARRDQFYNAIFEIKNGEITRLCDDRMITATDLANELKAKNCKVMLMGDGAELFYCLANEKDFYLAPETIRVQRAAGIAIVASETTDEDAFVTPEKLATIYLRKSQAEREREEKLNTDK